MTALFASLGAPGSGPALAARAFAPLTRRREADIASVSALSGEAHLAVRGGGTSAPTACGAGILCVADARIDNRDELATDLATAGVKLAADAAPAAWLGAVYRVWGIDGFARIIGDFAAVLCDEPRRRLVAVRDCFGIRPLCFHRGQGRLTIASELRQLRRLPGIDAAIDDDVASDFVHMTRWADARATIYRDIRQVRPAHAVLFDRSGESELRYYRWQEPAPLRYRDRRDYAAHLRELLAQAVADRVRGQRTFGLLLSGGLDSSCVAAFAASELRARGAAERELRTYSLEFDRFQGCDERQYSRAVANAIGSTAIRLKPEAMRPFVGSVDADDPVNSTAAEPHWDAALDDLVDHGGRVMLTGDGGETLFLAEGAWHLYDLVREGQATAAWRELRGYRRRWGCWPELPLRWAVSRRLPQGVYEQLPLRGRAAQSWIDPDRRWAERRLERWRTHRPPRVFDSFARQHAFEAMTCDGVFGRGWWQPAARRRGAEYVYPFMDRRLHEFVYSIPVELFYASGIDRAIVRESLAGLIPDPVRRRLPQTVFNEWFQGVAQRTVSQGALRSWRWPAEVGSLPRSAEVALARAGDGASARQLLGLGLLVSWYDSEATAQPSMRS